MGVRIHPVLVAVNIDEILVFGGASVAPTQCRMLRGGLVENSNDEAYSQDVIKLCLHSSGGDDGCVSVETLMETGNLRVECNLCQ